MQRNRICQVFFILVLLSLHAAASPITFETLPDFGQKYSAPVIDLPIVPPFMGTDPELLFSNLPLYTLLPAIDDGAVFIDLPIVALAATEHFEPFIDLPISTSSPQPSPVTTAPEPVMAVLIGAGLLIFSLIPTRHSLKRRP
jgi:hypothetical protein